MGFRHTRVTKVDFAPDTTSHRRTGFWCQVLTSIQLLHKTLIPFGPGQRHSHAASQPVSDQAWEFGDGLSGDEASVQRLIKRFWMGP